MTSPAPTDKITAVAAAAAGVVLAAWILELLGITMPPQVQTALAVALVALAGYVKTERGSLAALLERRARHRE